MRTPHLNGLLIVAVLAISTAPLFAQGAQPDVAKLKAEARNVVGIIGSDKAKTQAYCQIASLGEQMRQAVQAKDNKKFEELAHRVNENEKQLGPEYIALIDVVKDVDANSKDAQEIVSMFDTLDNSCPH